MKAATVTKITEAMKETTLRDFEELLASPFAIDAVVSSGNSIDGELIEQHSVAIILTSGKVITIHGQNEAMALLDSMRRGLQL